jgi:hypothetical protein
LVVNEFGEGLLKARKIHYLINESEGEGLSAQLLVNLGLAFAHYARTRLVQFAICSHIGIVLALPQLYLEVFHSLTVEILSLKRVVVGSDAVHPGDAVEAHLRPVGEIEILITTGVKW